jgi:ketosteroid isomerase-like protein
MKHLATISLFVFAFAFPAVAQPPKPVAKKSVLAAPDRAYAQKIWDGWSTLDPANVAGFYASGPHAFFDIAPLKYGSWEEYENGVKTELATYKSATFAINDDLAIHPHGELAWGTATVKYEMTEKSGKVDMGNFRWTVIFENEDGKWMIVHEHVSAPIQ